MKIMNKQITILSIMLILFLASCKQESDQLTIDSEEFSLTLNKDGSISGFYDKSKNKNYLDISKKAYLMSVRIDREFEFPNSMKKTDDLLIITYPSGNKATIKYLEKETHCTFELIKMEGDPKVELITWGPYPTTISKIIGETVGVARGEEFALGIQSLNIKTLGGYPYQENDCMPEFDYFQQKDEKDLNAKGKSHVLYRIEAAKPTKAGSALQAYCRNRDEDRIIENLNHKKFVAPAYYDGGVIGSKIALFGC
jgi:hypothetical protein